MLIQSQYVDNSRSEQEFFSIVSDMRNIPALLPEQAINVQANEDNLSFTVQGMGSIALRVSQRVTYSLVQLVPVGKTPFPFVLSIKIAGLGNNCRVMYEIDAELNPLMAMMAKRPLQNLVDMMADKTVTL
jgi:carbon monoxide dehydrogenase subunit G